MINSCEIWKDINVWKNIINISIEEKYNIFRRKEERKLLRLKNNDKEAMQNIITPKIPLKIDNEILIILTDFINHLIDFKIDIKEIENIMDEFSKKYSLSKFHYFEIKINLIIFKTNNIIKEKYKSKILKCSDKLLKRTDNDKILSSIILSIKYMNKMTLRNILILNKNSYKVLKIHVFKYLLTRSKYTIPVSLHYQIWKQILNIVNKI